MKIFVFERSHLMKYIGAFIIVVLCTVGCQNHKRVERISQGDVKCQVVIEAKWGDGVGEFGYLPDDQSHSVPQMPFRYQIDNGGNIYVSDLHNERVLVFSEKGTFLRGFNVPISNNEEFMTDIAVRDGIVAVATTNHIYIFDKDGEFIRILVWPADVGQYGLCSEDMAGKKVQVDEDGNVYACGVGGFERGGVIVQFDREGNSRKFFEGEFDHFVVGWDGSVYIEHLTSTTDYPLDSQIIGFDFQGNQLGEVVISGKELVDSGLLYPGLLVAVDARGDLYGNVINVFKNQELVSKEALVQMNTNGDILRIVELDKFSRPAGSVIDKEGNFYLWDYGEIPSDPAEIWRCSP